MRKLLLLACVCTASIQLPAQTIEFIEPRNVQGVPEAEFSTFKVGDYYYVLQKRYRMMAPVMYDLQLDAYDTNRKPIGSYAIDKMLEMGDANIWEGIFPLKDKLVMFKSEYSKASGSKMSYLYYYPFEVNGKRQKKNQLATIMAESAFNSGNFGVNVSPDGTKVVVISEQPHEKDGMERCVITVFDDQFKQLWKKEYTFPYESSKAPRNTVFVNNNGDVFILKQINLKKEHDKFSVFVLPNGGKEVSEKKIELGNGFTIATYKHLFTASGELQIAGYSYMNKKVGINVETPDGIFYLGVKPGGDMVSKLNPMPPTTRTALQLLVIPDNTLALLGEHQYTKSNPVPGKPGEFTYEYTGGDFSLTKLDGSGIEQWTYKFDRNLRSTGDGGKALSVFAWNSGTSTHILFQDVFSRHDDKKQFIEFGSRRINLFQTIGADGKLQSESVILDPRIAGKKGEYLFIPATGSVYKDNKIFMLATRGLELVGATISY